MAIELTDDIALRPGINKPLISDSRLVKGASVSINSLADIDNIPVWARADGQFVYNKAEKKYYNFDDGVTNANLKPVEMGGGSTDAVLTNVCLNSDFADGKTNWTTMDNTEESRVTIESDEFLGAYKAVLYSTAGSRAGIKQSIAGIYENTYFVGMWVKPTRKETDNYPRIMVTSGAGTILERLIDDDVWTALPLNEWSYISTYVLCPNNGLIVSIGRSTEQVWTMEVTEIVVTNITKGFENRPEEVVIADFNTILAKKFEKKYFANTMVVTIEDFITLDLTEKIDNGVSIGTSKAIANKCLNSNFTNGKSDWTPMEFSVDANVTVITDGGIVGNSISLAATGANPTGIVQGMAGSLNDIFYVGMWVKPTRKEVGGYPRININNIVTDAILERLCEDAAWDAMPLNQWTYVSTFVTSPADGITLNIGRKTGQLYTMEVSAIMVINLTQDLGSKAIGLRKTDLNYMLEKYEGRHFASTGTLTTDDFATATLAKLNAYLDSQT